MLTSADNLQIVVYQHMEILKLTSSDRSKRHQELKNDEKKKEHLNQVIFYCQ